MALPINNRDLSWLAFNDRVLQEAEDKSVPLLQRVRFLGIFSNNLDEFIKVRVANIIRFAKLKERKPSRFSGGYTAKELLPLVNSKVLDARKKFSLVYDALLKGMETEGICIVNELQLSETQIKFCREYFHTVISPVLVPLMVRKSMQLPFLSDKNIYLGVKMVNGKQQRYAIVQVPVNAASPRFIVLPSAADRVNIIFIDDIIRLCLDEIFFMFRYERITAHTFKLMRDALLTIDDDLSKSLIEKMEEGIQNRKHGEPVRLIYDREMPDDLLKVIAGKLKLKGDESLTPGGRYHLLRDLMKFPAVRPELENDAPAPLVHPAFTMNSSIFKVIKKKDVLLHYPYHTFNHFIDFLREAAIDPHVERICITLYRTAEHSRVINALVNAAKNGKQVIVMLELLARFDEEQNIENLEKLQKEGIKVIHGIAGLKVHSKLVLIEYNSNTRASTGYVYIGTGNFNESTSRIYSDFGLFTSHSQIVADARAVFGFLSNTHQHFKCKHLLVAPYYMRNQFSELIEKETRLAAKGENAYIDAKLNSLTDERIIRLLYKAGQTGVKIRLIVRGACLIQGGIPGISENIRVISIVDKYLEHARLFIFHQGGEEKTFIGSADWMPRNMDRRVEVCTPILAPHLKKQLRDFFDLQWSDNVKARKQDHKAENRYVERGAGKDIRSQEELFNYYTQETNEN